jgi:hypothetical protein
MAQTANRVQAFLERAKKIKSGSSDERSPLRGEDSDRSSQAGSLPRSISPKQINNVMPKPAIPFIAAKTSPTRPPIPGGFKQAPKFSSLTPQRVQKEDAKSKTEPPRKSVSPLKSPHLPSPHLLGSTLPKPSLTITSPVASPAPGNVTSREMDLESVNQLESLMRDLSTSRQYLEEQILNQKKREEEIIEHLKEAISKAKVKEEDPEARKSSQVNYKRKMEKIMKTVKEQGMIMDQKLYALQQENKLLKSKLEDIEELPDNIVESSTSEEIQDNQLYSQYLERQLQCLFLAISTFPSTPLYKQMCLNLAKKLSHESYMKKVTEDQARQMISENDKAIATLEERIRIMEGKNLAETIEL